MNLSLSFQKRDFSGPLALPTGLAWAVDRLSWAAVGGCDRARLVVRGDLGGLEDLLRCPLCIARGGQPGWWGYVSAVERRAGGLRLRWDLDPLANSAAVSYQVIGFSPWSGRRVTTPFLRDTASAARYGEKQRIYPAGAMSVAQAGAYQAGRLAEHAWPAQTGGAWAAPAQAVPDRRGDYAVVEARGWWHTTAWRYYEDPRGQELDTRAGVELVWGDSPARAKIAQSVTSAGSWRTQEVWLLLGSRSAADTLVLEVYNDLGGRPGGPLLASTSITAAGLSAGLEWQRFTLNQPVNLSAGADYWLVLSRTGAPNPAACYVAGVDTQMHYPAGVLAIYDGAVWVGALADLNFMLVGQEETTTHLARMLSAEWGGQFLAGARIEAASGIHWPMFRDGSRTVREEIEAALAQGAAAAPPLPAAARLLASVDAQRVARIYPQPGPETARARIDAGGRLRGPDGELLGWHDQPAGQWVIAGGAPAPAGPLWLERVVWAGDRLVGG